MSDDKYLASEAPEGNLPADGVDTHKHKATTITVKTFFSGYMLAGMDGQEFAQLTPEQQMRAQFEFIGGRAMYILDLDFDDTEAPPRNIGAEARRILTSLEKSLTAIDEADIYAAAMESVNIGRWMERVTSGQLAAKAITFSVNNDELAAAQAKYSQEQREKGRKRWANDEINQTISAIVERLACRVDELGDPAPPRELWPELYSQMDAKCMRPTESDNAITCEGQNKPYKYDAFSKQLQRIRNRT